jgi:L,D-peptidoglycan transpeptidase YkuD (ErfK/YbiS/YcfS/YnhG family)
VNDCPYSVYNKKTALAGNVNHPEGYNRFDAHGENPDNLAVSRLKCVALSSQAITVTTEKYEHVKAALETFQKVGGIWQRAFQPMPALIGRNGFAYNKVEGDGKSPIGTYTFGICFGRFQNPGTLMPYRQTTQNDYWIDDTDSVYYNSWQVGPAFGRWKSAEGLSPTDGTYYDYAIVINYNTVDRIPGRGSAIFLHIWDGPDVPTLGCIAIEYTDLLKVIKWLDPCKKPIIIQGPVSEVMKW